MLFKDVNLINKSCINNYTNKASKPKTVLLYMHWEISCNVNIEMTLSVTERKSNDSFGDN